MQWYPRYEGKDEGSFCEFTVSDGLPTSCLWTYLDQDGTWSWEVNLFASRREHFAAGDGCAADGKARFMAMSLVSALLQIIDSVQPDKEG